MTGRSFAGLLEGRKEDLANPDRSYVLHGKERYFLRRAVSLLKQRILPLREDYDLLYHSVYGPEVSGVELVDLARSVPFFDRTRLVVVWDADKIREKDRTEIQGYAEDPAPFTHMVFVAGEEAPTGLSPGGGT